MRLGPHSFLLAVLVCAAAQGGGKVPRVGAGEAVSNPPEATHTDAFGGIVSLRVDRGTGHFRAEKIGDRWLFVTPEGHAFWMLAVYNVNMSGNRIKAKYGDSDLTWGPQQVRRLKAWGFNALGEYANNWTLPWTTIRDRKWPTGLQPVKTPAIPFPLQAAWYSQTNLFNYANGPVKELIRATDSHFTGYRGQFPDVFDPNFDLWVNARAASREYAQAAASPWLLGFSSDDTDYLTGFGPGPDFDSGGHAHPHLGYVTLLTPPDQIRNRSRGVTYTDTKVHTKYALRDFLRTKYTGIDSLNSAWSSAYTTWDSDGGWPNGRGFLDENGKGAWVGTDSVALSNTHPTVRGDLDAFLYEIAKQYFSIYRKRLKQHYPNALYLGPTTVGGWGAPARRQILKAAGQFLDVLRTTYNGDHARLDFMTKHAGDLPIATWLGAVANADSAFFQFPPKGQSNIYKTQSARAAYYRTSITSYLNTTAAPTNTKPIVGIQWWEFADNWGEKANWGLVTPSDNAYDGVEAVAALGTDPWGYRTGGEERNFGDFLSSIRQTNLSIMKQLRRELGPLSRDDRRSEITRPEVAVD